MICIKHLQSKSQAKDFQYPDAIKKGSGHNAHFQKGGKTQNETTYKL